MYWQADPGTELKLFLFEFKKAGESSTTNTNPRLPIAPASKATVQLDDVQKECRRDTGSLNPEWEADVLLGHADVAESHEPIVFCTRSLERHQSTAERSLYARALLLAGRTVESRAVFEELALLNDSHSNLVLGFLYSNYKEKAPVKALHHFLSAYVQGEPYGAYGLGLYFELGMHDVPDYTQAAVMYKQVPSLREAQFRLAQLYYFGLGVRKDASEAMVLYRKSAAGGYQLAIDLLESNDTT